MLPTLPPQVIDLILSDFFLPCEVLPLCRVSRSFLEPARRGLYHTLHIHVPPAASPTRGERERRELRREETILRYPHLAKLVRWVSVGETDFRIDGPSPSGDAPLALARILGTCRKIRWLDLTPAVDNFAPVLLAARLPLLTRLYINTETPYQHLFPLFPSLRHLIICPTDEHPPIPDDLLTPVHLPSVRIEYPLSDGPLSARRLLRALVPVLCPPNNTVLRRLHIPIDVLFFPDFDISSFPSLYSLSLHVEDDYKADAVVNQLPRVLNQLPHLESLALHGDAWADPAYDPLRNGQLSKCLPPRLKQLALGRGFSLAEALPLLIQAARSGLQIFVWDAPNGMRESSDYMEVLAVKAVCAVLGVVHEEARFYHALTELA